MLSEYAPALLLVMQRVWSGATTLYMELKSKPYRMSERSTKSSLLPAISFAYVVSQQCNKGGMVSYHNGLTKEELWTCYIGVDFPYNMCKILFPT